MDMPDVLTHSYVRIDLPEEYAWVALTAGLLSFEILLIGFFFPSKIRGKIFNKQFMEENFGKMHMEELKLKANDLKNLREGYPDTGYGVYSDKLSYEDWIEWNKTNRSHLNSFDQITIVVFCILVTGLVLPKTAIVLGAFYGITRPLFFIKTAYAKGPGVLTSSRYSSHLCTQVTTWSVRFLKWEAIQHSKAASTDILRDKLLDSIKI